jgi:arsenate reductase
MKVTIYHNPRCSKSRQTLQLIQEQGIEPDIIKYLETPPSAEEIKTILTKLAIEPRELLRKNEPDYKAAGLNDTSLDDDTVINAMVDHPKLIERPIVLANDQAIIGRPPENVLAIL